MEGEPPACFTCSWLSLRMVNVQSLSWAPNLSFQRSFILLWNVARGHGGENCPETALSWVSRVEHAEHFLPPRRSQPWSDHGLTFTPLKHLSKDVQKRENVNNNEWEWGRIGKALIRPNTKKTNLNHLRRNHWRASLFCCGRNQRLHPSGQENENSLLEAYRLGFQWSK